MAQLNVASGVGEDLPTAIKNAIDKLPTRRIEDAFGSGIHQIISANHCSVVSDCGVLVYSYTITYISD
jgi:hypothetical protein